MRPSPVTLSLKLPWPCSVNHYYFTANVRGRLVRLIGKEGKEYQRAVGEVLAKMGNPRLLGPLRVDRLILCPPDRARRDLDNVLKCLWDSLQDREDRKKKLPIPGLFADDNQIREYNHVAFGPVHPGGQVLLTISQMTASLLAGCGEPTRS